SEADLAFCRIASFWVGRDAARIDAWYRASALSREKWERQDYRERTIQTAIDSTTEVFSPRSLTSSLHLVPTSSQLGRGTSSLVPASFRRDEVDEVISHLVPEPISGSKTPAPEPLPEPPQKGKSWWPLDLIAVAARLPEPPAILGLFYPGLNHLLSGES